MAGPSDVSAAGGARESEPGPALTVAVVARRIGVAPATLRTWDRRYGLGPSQHVAGAHRRYAPTDVARLEVMRRLTHEGVSPSEAARVALQTDPRRHASSPTACPTPSPRRAAPTEGRAGGGRVAALPARRQRRDPRPGASSHGAGRARRSPSWSTRASSAVGSVPRGTSSWCRSSTAVGARWEATGEGVEVEHLLADTISSSLRAVVGRVRRPLNARPVLLASAENELHALPARRAGRRARRAPGLGAHARRAGARGTRWRQPYGAAARRLSSCGRRARPRATATSSSGCSRCVRPPRSSWAGRGGTTSCRPRCDGSTTSPRPSRECCAPSACDLRGRTEQGLGGRPPHEARAADLVGEAPAGVEREEPGLADELDALHVGQSWVRQHGCP